MTQNRPHKDAMKHKKFSFADEAGQYNLVMSVYILPPFVYNPNLVAAKEINAWKDLLAPK